MVLLAFLVMGRVWGVFYTTGTPMRTRVVVNGLTAWRGISGADSPASARRLSQPCSLSRLQ